ncbi:Cu/Ag efflux pump CusA [Bradyrhizobium sp. USDA 4486]
MHALDGTGSEIMQRIAVSMIGGMVSSTLLTLIVIPTVFGLVKGFRLPRDRSRRAAMIGKNWHQRERSRR